MPELVSAPSRVPVPGGKVIEEFAGRESSGDDAVSVAVMTAPPGWSEPVQAPDFDEVTVVLSGALTVEHDGGMLTVGAGQAVVTRAGERVRYSVGEAGAHYVAVCVPAFAIERAHREEAD
jgi:mannose-6-phosphate isomerase-like protein (cupin superfamily)